ncbi:ATP-binding protein [Flavobacterium endoglycinae]|uniref:ATP-binding protein n=1 Tax=Flavobacterium endoglycinae TaxID=2816357 RepID=A0ABX7QEV3_9FLAO|nr:ATP-binding protein [Flavobacterium endoglycinae]QSW89601.1 ATP-binding protein [Flavobacterium endoglycinae]
MTQITIKQVENAFVPAREISDPEKFSGRETYVKDAYLALIADGSNIAIVGNRGIGKSSLARQIINISQGDNRLLDKLGIYSDEKLDYLSIYYACGNSITNTQELLERLLTTRECFLEWIYEIPTATKELDKLNGNLNIGIASVGGDVSSERTTTSTIQKHSIETIFHNVISDLLKAKVAKNGVLIVIDEFDQIKDISGFASFLKSLATNTPGLKFCIVGVAQDIQNLMKEHESSDRLFAGSVINLPVMGKTELRQIIITGENSINNLITFSESAKDKIIDLSQGHPYIVHLIGKQAFRTAYFDGKYEELDENYVENILKAIAEKEADPVLEGRYKKAVASSQAREIVLKALANYNGTDNEIFTTEVYKKAIEKDVDNPSQYVGHLVTNDYGSEVIKVRDKYYRFKDSLFQTYVKARPSIY